MKGRMKACDGKTLSMAFAKRAGVHRQLELFQDRQFTS